MTPKLLFIVTEDWYFWSHRLPIARAARDAGFHVAVVCRVTHHDEKIRQEGFDLIHLDLERGKFSPFRELRTIVRLRKIFRSERPDLVHNVAIKPVILGSIAARSISGVKLVNALAGLGFLFTSEKRWVRLMRSVVRIAFRTLFRNPQSRVIVQNTTDRDVLTENGVPASNIVLIPGSGVDTDRYRPTMTRPAPLVAAMVSRMLWDKGVGELSAAARILKSRCPELRVRLVGPPDPENPSSIEERVLREWVKQGFVEWAGHCDDIPAVWESAQIAVLPSYREGLPMSLLEAAACGRALVATDVPGCRDVVIHEKTGLLVPPRDEQALADAIFRLATDYDLRDRLGSAARAHVLERFTVDRVIKDTLAVYKDLFPVPPTA